MLYYKFDVYKALTEKGIGFQFNRDNHIFSQSTMCKLKNNNPNISIENINKICLILNLQPGDILGCKSSSEDDSMLSLINNNLNKDF